MSLVVYPKSTSEVTESEALLLPIAKQINDYWQPIKTWTTIALTISQNGLALSAASLTILIALIVYRLILVQQEKASLLILYNKLPVKSQQLIKAVQSAKKQGTPTTEGIANQLAKQTNNQIDHQQLKQDLEEAKKIGLIKGILVNREDKPAIAWKSLLPKRNIFKSIPIISRFF